MRRSIIISIAIIMTTGACAPRADNLEAFLRERLVRHYAEDDKAARAINGEVLRLDITFVDLDSDGMPEAIVRLDHPAFCGSRGCAIDVVELKGDRIHILTALIAHDIYHRRQSSREWPDLIVDKSVWEYDGTRYRFSHRETEILLPLSVF